MRHSVGVVAVVFVVLGLVASCAPATTVQPEQIVVNASFEEAFDTVSKTINTQPYPSNKGGWVVVNSDQVGGLIVAEMTWVTRNWFSGGETAHVERVSVAFNALGENQTALNVSGTRGQEARELMDAIVRDVTSDA